MTDAKGNEAVSNDATVTYKVWIKAQSNVGQFAQVGDTNAVKINFIKDWYFDNYKFRCKVSDGKTEVYTNEIQISKKS